MKSSTPALKKIPWFANKVVSHLNRLTGNYSDVVWLFGDGRSGTTWLADLINYQGGYYEMFEPFHPRFVKQIASRPLHNYIPPGEVDENFEQFASDVFRGCLINKRVNSQNRSYFHEGLLIKDIFANLSVAWAAEKFPTVKKIFLIRNPFAVALSKYNKRSWIWLENPKELLSQKQLRKDYLAPFESLINAVGDDYIERQIMIWAIIHYVPLMQLQSDQVHIVFYEQLYSDPISELRRLYDYLGRDKVNLENSDYLSRVSIPSRVSGDSSTIVRGESPITQWREELSVDQIRRGRMILDSFELDTLYRDECMPDRSALASFIQQ